MTKRLLIVDDEERIREVVRACLEDLAGWEVVAAESGADGLNQAKTSSPDAILLDISMPDMDGFTFFQRLQSDPGLGKIPVILLTAKVLSRDQAKFAEMGVAGVLSKPFDPLAISQQIATLLGWNQEPGS